MTDTANITPACATCGTALPVPPAGRAGRPLMYCSQACRTRAYRIRRTQQLLEHQARHGTVPIQHLANALAQAARRIATATATGRSPDPADLSALETLPLLITGKTPRPHPVGSRPESTAR